MNEARVGDPLNDISALLWVLAAVVAVLSAHIAVGYARQSQRAVLPRTRRLCVAAAAATLGTGSWSAMLLGLSSQGLNYSLGYLGTGLAGAWATVALATAAAWVLLLRWPRPAMLVLAGVLIGGGALGAQMLLVRSAGLLPGVLWQKAALAMAALVPALGAGAGLWMAFLREGRNSRGRQGWRWGAAAVIGLSLIAGQELAMSAARMSSQRSSAYEHQVPALALCAFAGLGVPILLMLLQMDLHLRRIARDGGDPAAPRRRRRSRRQRPIL